MSNNSELSVWRCGLRAEKLFEKRCPLQWDALKPTNNQNVRFCETCEKNVYEVQSPEDFVRRSKNRECVAINVKFQYKEQKGVWLGQPMPWNSVTEANPKEWWAKIRDLGDSHTIRMILKDIENSRINRSLQERLSQDSK